MSAKKEPFPHLKIDPRPMTGKNSLITDRLSMAGNRARCPRGTCSNMVLSSAKAGWDWPHTCCPRPWEAWPDASPMTASPSRRKPCRFSHNLHPSMLQPRPHRCRPSCLPAPQGPHLARPDAGVDALGAFPWASMILSDVLAPIGLRPDRGHDGHCDAVSCRSAGRDDGWRSARDPAGNTLCRRAGWRGLRTCSADRTLACRLG